MNPTILQWSDDVPSNVTDLYVTFPDMTELNPASRRNDKTIAMIRDAFLHRDTASMIPSETSRPMFFVDTVPEGLVDALVTRIAKLAPEGSKDIELLIRLCKDTIIDERVSIPYVAWSRCMSSVRTDAATWDALRGSVEACFAYDMLMQRTMQWGETSMLNTMAACIERVLESLPATVESHVYPSADVRKGRINHVAKDAEAASRSAFVTYKNGVLPTLKDADN